MAVLINFKICDNAKECNGIAVCPTGALSWDSRRNTIKIDNSLCVSCGLCESACEVGAIHVARTEEEYARIKAEIDADPRKISDLFVDRYGAEPITPAFQIEHGFDTEILEASKLVAVELYTEDSIHCLLHSIPIKYLFSGVNVKYRKCLATTELIHRYTLKDLPALLFFKNGALVGRIDGFYSNKDKEKLRDKILSIVKHAAS